MSFYCALTSRQNHLNAAPLHCRRCRGGQWIAASRTLTPDGNLTPNAHDGMAALALPNGNTRLIRNHENRDGAGTPTVKGNPATAYDARDGGSTTSLEVRQHTDGSAELVRDFVSLNGTIVNLPYSHSHGPPMAQGSRACPALATSTKNR